MPDAITDADVRAAQAGDPAGFRRIYDVMSPVVLGYLTAHRVSDAPAATSEVFLTLFRRLPDLHGGAAGLRSFVLSVAHARLVDDVRRRTRHPEAVEYDGTADPRVNPSAESEALDSAGTRQLLELLAQLPDDQRDVVALRFVADLSLEEVAEIVQKSVGAVKQLQRRGLLRLRGLAESSGVTRW